MKNSEFENYSLVLIKDDKIVYSSKKSGLKPLAECINKFKSKITKCTLYDKVIGLAAARLIVYSGMISNIITPLCSKPAFDLLKKEKIELKAGKIVDNILRKDKKGICPMELKAMSLSDEELLIEIKKNSKCN